LITYKIFKFILLCFTWFTVGYAQTGYRIDSLPNEEVVLSSNDSVFVTGEVLYYKMYSLLYNKTLCTISKIGYVELINDQKQSLFKHKLILNNGLASGDFFIPSNASTGHYKLVGYTKLTNTSNVSPFYQKDIYIINPYIVNIYNKQDLGPDVIHINKQETVAQKINNNAPVKIILDSNVYNIRSLVSIKIDNQLFNKYGNYSLSVHKVNPIKVQNTSSKIEYPIIKNEKDVKVISIRGEVISGVVKSRMTDVAVPNVNVAFSIPGNYYVFKNVKTDEEGRFYVSLHENYKDTEAIIQVMDIHNQDYKIVMDENVFPFYENLSFQKVHLNPNIKDWLVNKSIYNQLENAYLDSKKDSIIESPLPKLFYGSPSITYFLDDYTRFPTLKETFVEVIQDAGVRRNNKSFSFKVFNYDSERDINYFKDSDPLVLFDGVLIQNSDNILDYNVNNIEKISVVSGIYFYGPSVFNGIIDIVSKKRDFSLPDNGNDIVKFNLPAPQELKFYYQPDYGNRENNLKRIPDFRTQLLWKPNIRLDSKTLPIQFYTSDVTGIFEIELDGFTFKGDHLNSKFYFEVKE